MKNPFIRNKNLTQAMGLVALILVVGQLLSLYFIYNIRFDFAFVDSNIYTFLFFIFGISLWYPVKYMAIESHSVFNLLFNHSITIAITSVIWLYSGYFILSNLFPDYDPFLFSTLFLRFLLGFLLFTIVVILSYVLIYYNNFKTKLVEETELNSLIKEAELKSLKYQINPHFIFNSLNSIASLTTTNPQKSNEMTINLSNYLRKTLSGNEKLKISLKEEIDNIKLYLEIEKVRFEEKLEFTLNVENGCSEIKIPSMILQPLIENVIKHGVYESTEKIMIRLNCNLEKDYLKLVIENNYDKDSVSFRGEGIGLKNIQSRLKLVYNQENLLTIKKGEEIFTATLFIPVYTEHTNAK